MTNEQIDQALVDEAMRLWSEEGYKRHAMLIAAQLGREGWMPLAPPVDHDVLVVREVLAGWYSGCGAEDEIRQGALDMRSDFQSALSAFRAAKGDA